MSGALTIDVDTLGCYAAIHGLKADALDEDPTYSHALPRFFELCERHGVRATLFVIGRDLERAGHREILRRAHDAGHEIASHSHHHDYRLSQLSPASIAADLARADEAIADAVGARPCGFRAPGYNQSEALFDAIEAQGYAYDSSFLPTPAYFAARALAINLYRARGRRSSSLVGDPREFLAPRRPFRPARGARHRAARGTETSRSFVEIPIAVAGPLRLPWLGTSIALAPDLAGRALTTLATRSRGPVVLELHAIDLLAGDEAPPALAEAQPDLRVSLDDKVRRLELAISALAQRGTSTMLELASG